MELDSVLEQSDALPDGWTLSTVGAEFDVQLGKMLDRAKNTGISKPYLGNRSVQWGQILTEELDRMRMSSEDMQRYRLERGDLLVCEGGEVGRSAIWDAPIPECYYQKALHRLRTRDGYEPKLMMAFLGYWASTDAFSGIVTQTSIAHLTKEKLEAIPLPVPPGEEQVAITSALSDFDTLLDALDALIEKKRGLKAGAMQRLLTGRQRLPGFSEAWGTMQIGTFGTTYGGLTGKTKRDFGTGTASYIPFMNVMAGVTIDPSFLDSVDISAGETQNRVLQGDLLFNTSSETPEELAMSSVLTHNLGELYLNSFCFGFRLSNRSFSPLYLAYYFRGSPGRTLMHAMAQGATRYNLSKRNFLNLKVNLPSGEEQEAIAGVLADMDAEIAALQARRAKAARLREGMMQELLTGRTRLV